MTAKKEVPKSKIEAAKPAKVVMKSERAAPKSLALKGEKRIQTHAAWKKDMMKKYEEEKNRREELR